MDVRERAIRGLRLIAAVEEHVAAEIDGPGYFGEVAKVLRLSAADRLDVAGELSGLRPSPAPEAPRLRLV